MDTKSDITLDFTGGIYMRKILACLMLVGLLSLGACGGSPDTSEKEKTDQKKTQANDQEETNSSEEPDNETEPDAGESSKENSEKSDESEIVEDEKEFMELGYDIFKAQEEEDYAYLNAIFAEGASLDKESNTFYFEDVTYPHEQEFIQVKQSDIEYRYIHEEDAETMIVGFAVVDYEAEFSFTIDFEFVQENGEWKMKDMDMNA